MSNIEVFQVYVEILTPYIGAGAPAPPPTPATTVKPQFIQDLIYNVTDDKFWFANADHHARVISALSAYNGTSLPNLILQPIDSTDKAAFAKWLQTHQQAHDAMNKPFGLASPDLTVVDLNDDKSVASWDGLHLDGHHQVVVRLGQG